MTAERHIRQMNDLLLAELGSNPLYAWIYSESPDFKRAMRKIDPVTSRPELAWRCPCGVNVNAHSVECSAGQLVVAEPIFIIRKTRLDMNDQWVLCCQQDTPTEPVWRKIFGNAIPYPRNGTWAPVATQDAVVCMPPGYLPGRTYTVAVIRAAQHTREQNQDQRGQDNEFLWREEQQRAAQLNETRYRIKEALPVSPDPGKRGNNVSFGGVDEQQQAQAQGEALISL